MTPHSSGISITPNSHSGNSTPKTTPQSCKRGLSQSQLCKPQSINDNAHKADDVRQGRKQVRFIHRLDLRHQTINAHLYPTQKVLLAFYLHLYIFNFTYR